MVASRLLAEPQTLKGLSSFLTRALSIRDPSPNLTAFSHLVVNLPAPPTPLCRRLLGFPDF